MCRPDGIELPYQSVRQQIAGAVNFVLHLERIGARRCVTAWLRINAYDPMRDRYDVTSPEERLI